MSSVLQVVLLGMKQLGLIQIRLDAQDLVLGSFQEISAE